MSKLVFKDNYEETTFHEVPSLIEAENILAKVYEKDENLNENTIINDILSALHSKKNKRLTSHLWLSVVKNNDTTFDITLREEKYHAYYQ